MVLEHDGTVSLYIGSSSVGQGIETMMAQIAADALDMPMARINRVQHGSTTIVKQGYGSYSLALDRDGRLGHRAGGGHSQGRDPRRRGEAPAMRAGRRSPSTATTAVGPNRASVALSALAADGIPPKAPIPATSAPTATARTPRMSRSIPAPAMSR